MRMTQLGLSARDVAAAIGCTPDRLSTAVAGVVRTPGMTEIRNKADEFTMRKLNERRSEIKEELADRGLKCEEVQVILPADNRIMVVADGEMIGFYDPVGKRFAPVR